MKRTIANIFILSILLLVSTKVQSQDFTSNLPIVLIKTFSDQELCDSIRQDGQMKIIFHNDSCPNSLADTADTRYINYDGRISIRTRGQTSQYPPKKPYAITTLRADSSHNNVSLLGMPAENDWVLNNIAYEPSYVRDYISYGLYSMLGYYSPRCRFCEVFLNDDYKGLYILIEKIKADENRIDIAKMDENDTIGENLTGGYIFKADKVRNDDEILFIDTDATDLQYTSVHPKQDLITQTQSEYLQNLYSELKLKTDLQNEAIDVGFPSIIDIPSFVDYMILEEYTSNVDAFHYSTYFHKDKMGKLRAGPVWDFNLTFGNDLTPSLYYNRSKYNIWQFLYHGNECAKLWSDLFYNPTFQCYLSRRWHELTAEDQPLCYNTVSKFIAETESQISEAITRDCERWNKTNHHTSNIDSLKRWITKRIEWMDSHIGSYDNCQDIEIPNLVISKINYYPKPYGAFSSNNLEFIEISNNSDNDVNATGIYLSALGINYIFPINSHIGPHQSVIICSDSASFVGYYGLYPYGHYTRHLSNTSQRIALSDAWGNLIDEVTYSCESPWPIEANCRGSFLELTDLNADNSLAENWHASQKLSLDEKHKGTIRIFPNPTNDFINIDLPTNEETDISIINSIGVTMFSTKINSSQATIDLKNMPTGIYMIKIANKNGTWCEKIIIK